MKCAVNSGSFATDKFHHIDLPAVRPAGLVNVVSKHPECRPNSVTMRYFYSSLDASVFEIELSLCYESCRRVLTFTIPAIQFRCRREFYCLDRERSVPVVERVLV